MCAAIGMRTTVTLRDELDRRAKGGGSAARLQLQDLVATSRRASARTSKTCATAGRNSTVCGGREPEPDQLAGRRGVSLLSAQPIHHRGGQNGSGRQEDR